MFTVKRGYRKREEEMERGGGELGSGLQEKGIWNGFMNATSSDHEKMTLPIIR